MSKFEPNKQHLREVLLHYFILKKSAAETHRILVEAYNENAPAEPTCREWFRRFKSGDFDLDDKERSGQPKKFQDCDLEALLIENPYQTLKELADTLKVGVSTVSERLKAMGMSQQQGNWVSHELYSNDKDHNNDDDKPPQKKKPKMLTKHSINSSHFTN